jgi:phage gpG-like protein
MPLRGDFGKAVGLARSFAGFARAAGGAASAGARAIGGGLAGSVVTEVARRIDSKTGLAESARAAVIKTTAECFQLQRDPSGSPWKPRKTRYGTYRDYLPILFDIQSSLTFEIEWRTGGFAVKAKSSKAYAFYHQIGNSRGLPQRSFLPSETVPGELRDQLQAAGSAMARSLVNRLRGG